MVYHRRNRVSCYGHAAAVVIIEREMICICDASRSLWKAIHTLGWCDRVIRLMIFLIRQTRSDSVPLLFVKKDLVKIGIRCQTLKYANIILANADIFFTLSHSYLHFNMTGKNFSNRDYRPNYNFLKMQMQCKMQKNILISGDNISKPIRLSDLRGTKKRKKRNRYACERRQVIWEKFTLRAIAAVLPLWQSVYSNKI